MQTNILPITLVASLALANAATAQNLDKAQEGRSMVGQCYATCMDRAQTTALALYERADRMTDLLISDEYHALNEASQNNLVRLEEDAICALAQDHVRALDGCYTGCRDVEVAYGVNQSHSRARFHQIYVAERDALRAVGLWSDYRNSASLGSAFNAGCDRYWASGQSATAPLSRVATVPARVRHRGTKLVRSKEASPQLVGNGGG